MIVDRFCLPPNHRLLNARDANVQVGNSRPSFTVPPVFTAPCVAFHIVDAFSDVFASSFPPPRTSAISSCRLHANQACPTDRYPSSMSTASGWPRAWRSSATLASLAVRARTLQLLVVLSSFLAPELLMLHLLFFPTGGGTPVFFPPAVPR